ncbi:beta-lactamase family protein [Streptomyces uncialis]|uniref:serine hydrolase domain-containing protein n=1 Tax=Streptomyces uncialis TaxID=1048205 RepID=UPI002E335C4F|nr:serine hydrolase domain-containing protein [Streptomyces uncialis]
MTAAVDPARWTDLLSTAAVRHGVPGAALAFHHDGRMHEFATGVLNRDTGHPVRTDSLFQIGSITKVWTATQIMQFVEQGTFSLDTPVIDVWPEFEVGGEHQTKSVTIRQLLSHTSGIDGDFFHDTGRGDDCLDKYADACRQLPAVHPLGATQSYCNSGFSLLGRLVERITGKTWDAALREQIIEPLGLTHTCTLPEEVLRHSGAVGHRKDGSVSKVWGLMRSAGPAGLICARAADVVCFGRGHLSGALLKRPEAMWEAQVTIPGPMPFASEWGLGWMLDTLSGRRILSHGGTTIGQSSMLWVEPESGFTAALVLNGGNSVAFEHELGTALFGELLGIEVPPPPGPPATPVDTDAARFAGVYESVGVKITITARDGDGPRLVMERKGDLAETAPGTSMDLVAVSGNSFVGHVEGMGWLPVVFYELADGSPYLHFGVRAVPKAD